MPEPPNPATITEEASQRELASTAVARPTAKAIAIAFAALLIIPATLEQTLHVNLKDAIQPSLQLALSQYGGFGNEKVVIAPNALLYEPGLRNLYGQPFLNPQYLAAKAKAAINKDGLTAAHPDPRPAFRQLLDDCRRAGIHLILVPVPDKPAAPPNPDLEPFLNELGAEALRITATPDSHLRYDTHWTPAFMDQIALNLATRLRTRGLAGPTQPLYAKSQRKVTAPGDLVEMLKLPPTQTLFPPETVTIEPITPIAPLPAPEVLLIGDSFTNIYSSPSLNWGTSAGLAEHIAYHLNAPVDAIATNGAGASIRQELARAAQQGRLARTRVIIYEFAARDLYLENWPPAPLGTFPRAAPTPKPEPAAPKPAVATPDTPQITVTGVITQMSRPIDPQSAPYEDALIYAKIKIEKVEKGAYAKPNAIVAFLAMKKRTLQPGAAHQVGDKVRLNLILLKAAPESIRGMQRSDDTEDYSLPPFYVAGER